MSLEDLKPKGIPTLSVLKSYNLNNTMSITSKLKEIKGDDSCVIVSPEPFLYQKELSSVSNYEERLDYFKKILKDRFYFISNQAIANTDDCYWFNTTTNGINLRPGLLNNDFRNTQAMKLSGECSHSLIGGRTGSGKSVFLNQIITSLMAEYPPWEIDIYLADFKKVEFSRYLSNDQLQPPHIQAVAATSEIRYVMSVLEHLYTCLNAREKVFSDLACINIQEFREKFNVVLPRIVFIVDEFQQLFLESSGAEAILIDKYLTTIAKKGRATGIHLMFASQELSGTLGHNTLSNFKMRFALPTTPETSMDLIDSKKGADDIKVGDVIGYDGETHSKYKVPFIQTYDPSGNETEFEKFLIDMKLNDDKIRDYYSKFKKFYQEDHRISMLNVDVIKSSETVVQQLKEIKEYDYNIDDLLILGESVVYKQLVNDVETVFLENKMKDNIAVLTDSYSKTAYIWNLLLRNYSSSINQYTHNIFNLNDTLYRMMKKEVLPDKSKLYYDKLNIKIFIDKIKTKIIMYDLLTSSSSLEQFTLRCIYHLELDQSGNSEEMKKAQAELRESFNDEVYTKYVNILESQYEFTDFLSYKLANEKLFNKFLSLNNKRNIFPKEVIWINGVENIEIDRTDLDIINQAPSINTRFVFLGNDDEDHRDIFGSCNYLFINHSHESAYTRYGLSYTKNNVNSIDMMIKNYNSQVSSKKFETNDLKVRKNINIDFENVELI